MFKKMEEIKTILKDFESRLKKIEEHLFEKKTPVKKISKLKGIPRGINDLIDNGFFNFPRTVDKIIKELETEGHFGSKARIDTAIRRDFFKRKGLLKRVKKEDKWHYFKEK
jgi:hypothetical protein